MQLPRPFQPHEPLNNAVYCGECKNFKQDIIGSKSGTCFEHPILDSNVPLDCSYYTQDIQVISILVFLKSGISIYHKAIVKDMEKEINPDLVSSFLQAINLFGAELTNEQISSIQFQKMNIVYIRGKNSNGAMIVKGKIKEKYKDMFVFFLDKLEETYPAYFMGEFSGSLLPEAEIDKIAFSSMREYIQRDLYSICPATIEKNSCLKCGKTHAHCDD